MKIGAAGCAFCAGVIEFVCIWVYSFCCSRRVGCTSGIFIFQFRVVETTTINSMSKQMGRPKVRTEDDAIISVRLPESLKSKVADRAWRERRSMNQMLRILVELGLEAQTELMPKTSDSLIPHADERVS